MNARKVLNGVLVLVMVLVLATVLAAMLPLNGGAVAPAQAQGVYERLAGTVIDQQGDPITGATVKVNEGETHTANPTLITSTLTVTKTGTGTGTVTSVFVGTVVIAPGINCGADCTEIYTLNTAVTLIATADSGSTFAGWSGDATGSVNPVQVTMTANKTVTATFQASNNKLLLPSLWAMGDGIPLVIGAMGFLMLPKT